LAVTLLHGKDGGQAGKLQKLRSYHRLTRGRCATSRAGFQIWPHDPHRQYVVSEIDLLVVLTTAD
jgi:hypothetical protein